MYRRGHSALRAADMPFGSCARGPCYGRMEIEEIRDTVSRTRTLRLCRTRMRVEIGWETSSSWEKKDAKRRRGDGGTRGAKFSSCVERRKKEDTDADRNGRWKAAARMSGHALSPQRGSGTRSGSRSSCAGTTSPPSQSRRTRPARTPL